MFDWHKAYETSSMEDLLSVFLGTDLRKDVALAIVNMLTDKPDSRRGAIVEKLQQEGYAKATVERSLKDLETIGIVSSEGKYLKTGRYRLNLSRFSSSLNRLSRTVKKIEQDTGSKKSD
jgi:predicted transcriptional regulator